MSKAKNTALVPSSEAALTNASSVAQGDLGGLVASEQAIIDQDANGTGSAASIEQVIVDQGSTSGAVIFEQAANAVPVELIKARVLVVCEYGAPNDVVELSAPLAPELRDVVDPDPAAVAYAESIQKA
ncbi:hypothetical protein BA896_012685 [Janthinobacterium lividum]|uniref:Uncharacterized protein n=1 Tax=Janthinobacterium lividum TaxID=29581 RepID=A0A1E8PVB1_9BURK|nr:hypothetical protein BA896_012685 [Janthinobacterium lividum]